MGFISLKLRLERVLCTRPTAPDQPAQFVPSSMYAFFFFVLFNLLLILIFSAFYICYVIRHSSNHPAKKKSLRTKSIRLCSVMGSGGHTPEMILLLENLGPQYNPRTYIIADTDTISEGKVIEHEKSRGQGTFNIERIPRSREVGQSYISSILTTLRATWSAFQIVWNASPDLLLVNGPGTCIPVVVAAALFDMFRLRDTIIIYQESICRVQRLSLSGGILYFTALADDIVVQWKQLKEKYPRTVLIDDLPES